MERDYAKQMGFPVTTKTFSQAWVPSVAPVPEIRRVAG